MDEVTVTVTLGRQKWDLRCTKGMTFGELKSLVEEKAGMVAGGVRLLHKGKSYADDTSLEIASVTTGTKLMALRTRVQHDAEKDQERKEKLSRNQFALADMKRRVESGEKSRDEASSSSKVTQILGDAAVDGQTSVLLIQGKIKFRLNVDMSSHVLSLKEKAAAMDGISTRARDIRLLFKGKFLKDDTCLADCGVTDGASLVMFFSARHHDAKEDFAEMSSIEAKVGALEKKARSVQSKAKHRMLDSVDLSIAKGELEETLFRLKDNLSSVRSEDNRRSELEKRLADVADIVETI